MSIDNQENQLDLSEKPSLKLQNNDLAYDFFGKQNSPSKRRAEK